MNLQRIQSKVVYNLQRQ